MDALFSIAAKILSWIRMGLTWLQGLFDRLLAFITGESDKPIAKEDIPDSPSQDIPRSYDDNGTDDNTALARMLASETRSTEEKIVVGWITAQRAKGRDLYTFLTSGHGYGPNDRRDKGQGIVHASTANPPTLADRKLAAGLLNGTIAPSQEIRSHKPGAWVERKQGVITDDGIIGKQKSWKEGIYGQLAGTKWVLFSPDSKPVYPKGKQTASEFLDNLPLIPALDRSQSQRVA